MITFFENNLPSSLCGCCDYISDSFQERGILKLFRGGPGENTHLIYIGGFITVSPPFLMWMLCTVCALHSIVLWRYETLHRSVERLMHGSHRLEIIHSSAIRLLGFGLHIFSPDDVKTIINDVIK